MAGIGNTQGNAELTEIIAKVILFPTSFFAGMYELYLKQMVKHSKKNCDTKNSMLMNNSSLLKIVFIISKGRYKIVRKVLLIMSLSDKYLLGSLSPSRKIWMGSHSVWNEVITIVKTHNKKRGNTLSQQKATANKYKMTNEI